MLHHPVSFITLIIIFKNGYRVSVIVFCPERFIKLFIIILDDGISTLQNIFRGAVILFERNLLGIFVIAFEVKNVGYISSPERVDALCIITHHTNILILLRQHFSHFVLGMVCILVLINHDVFKPVLILFKYIRVLFKKFNWFNKEVVKIHGVCLAQPHIIHIKNAGRNIIKSAVYKPGFV